MLLLWGHTDVELSHLGSASFRFMLSMKYRRCSLVSIFFRLGSGS